MNSEKDLEMEIEDAIKKSREKVISTIKWYVHWENGGEVQQTPVWEKDIYNILNSNTSGEKIDLFDLIVEHRRELKKDRKKLNKVEVKDWPKDRVPLSLHKYAIQNNYQVDVDISILTPNPKYKGPPKEVTVGEDTKKVVDDLLKAMA